MDFGQLMSNKANIAGLIKKSTIRYETGTHSVCGVQTSYQGCCWTQKNAIIWKPRQMRIWVNTENNRDPEMRPDGGRRGTSSDQAGFRLTEEKKRIAIVKYISRQISQIVQIVNPFYTDW